MNPLWLTATRIKECMVTHSLFPPPLLPSVTSALRLSVPLSVSPSTFLGKHFMPEQSASAYLHPYPIALLMAPGPQALSFSGDGVAAEAYLGSRWCTWGPMCVWTATHLKPTQRARTERKPGQASQKPQLPQAHSNLLYIPPWYSRGPVKTVDTWQTHIHW